MKQKLKMIVWHSFPHGFEVRFFPIGMRNKGILHNIIDLVLGNVHVQHSAV